MIYSIFTLMSFNYGRDLHNDDNDGFPFEVLVDNLKPINDYNNIVILEIDYSRSSRWATIEEVH